MDINALIQQLPNFAGLLIALAYMWKMSSNQQKMIEMLVNTIIKRENCPEEADPDKPP